MPQAKIAEPTNPEIWSLMQIQSHNVNERIFWWLLIAITVFAFVIRLVSIDHNLPYQIISDEGSDLTTAVRLLQGELPARHVRYHRSLIAYSNLLPIAGVFVVNFIDGDVRSIADFQDLYFANRAEFIFATRLWMSILTSGAIFFTGLAASYINRQVGLFAALILALNAFYFHTSLFALPDALGASMTGLGIWTIMRVWKYRRTRDYIIMSCALALVMLAKLQAATIGIGFLIAHTYIVFDKVNRDWKRLPLAYVRDKNIWIAAITGVVGNILFNPFAFIHFNDFIFEITRLRGMMYVSEPSLSFWVSQASTEMGNVLLVISRWTTILLVLALIPIWKHRRDAPYIMTFAMMLIISWTVLSSRLSPISHFYYWNPVVIVMAIMGGIGGIFLIECLQSLNKQYARTIALIVIGTLTLLEGAFLVSMFSIMNQPTTQELAREWVVEHIEADTGIFTGDPLIISIPLYRNARSILNAIALEGTALAQWEWYLEQEPNNRPHPAYELYSVEYTSVIDSFADISALIESESIEYVILADYGCSDVDDDPRNDSAQAFPPRSAEMLANWELVYSASAFESAGCDATIHPRTKIAFSAALYQQVRMGPYIEIYRIP